MEIKKTNALKNKWKDWVAVVCVFVVSFLIIRALLTPVFIHGESMMPTLVHGDWVLTEKISHNFSSPKFNDIIVFKFEEKDQMLIKRVIGVPGDEISIKGNYFFVNDELLEDEFTTEITSIGDTKFPLVVEDDSYFVLGDNRNMSRDSTYSEVGLVEKKDIVGRPFARIYPITDFKFLNNNN